MTIYLTMGKYDILLFPHFSVITKNASFSFFQFYFYTESDHAYARVMFLHMMSIL